MRKTKREHWKIGYRNVIRNSKGHFVSLGKWTPKKTVKVFEHHYKTRVKELKEIREPIREKYKYNFAAYITEDTDDGTGVKEEFYVEDFITDLTPEELDNEYREELINVLKDKVGRKGSKFGHPHFIILKQKKTWEQKSIYMDYKANVMNINPRVNEKFRYIRTQGGHHKCEN